MLMLAMIQLMMTVHSIYKKKIDEKRQVARDVLYAFPDTYINVYIAELYKAAAVQFYSKMLISTQHTRSYFIRMLPRYMDIPSSASSCTMACIHYGLCSHTHSAYTTWASAYSIFLLYLKVVHREWSCSYLLQYFRFRCISRTHTYTHLICMFIYSYGAGMKVAKPKTIWTRNYSQRTLAPHFIYDAYNVEFAYTFNECNSRQHRR